MDESLVLLAFDLFGPNPAEVDPSAGLKLPALELLLARAVRAKEERADRPYEAELCDLFEIEPPPEADLPVAALTHLVDFEGDHEGVWMRADPVYLRPDLHKLLLFDSTAFHLEKAEAEGLVSELNLLLKQQGRQLSLGKDWTRWYLRLPQAPRIKTYPPGAIVAQHIDPYLPTGPDSQDWHRLFNEVQMILHTANVNQAREARGELPINSLWFWGSGVPPAAPKARWSRVLSSEPVAQGLAKLCGCTYAEVPAGAREWFEAGTVDGDTLVVLHKGQSLAKASYLSEWRDYITALEKDWFAPLAMTLKKGGLKRLTILTEGARFTVTRKSLRRFWLRRKRIALYRITPDDARQVSK